MNESKQHISLFLPAFFQLPAELRATLLADGLPLLLGRGQRLASVNGGDWHEALWRLQGMGEALGEDVPVAALRMLGAGQPLESGVYACVDPVNVSPNRDHLLLLGNDMLAISLAEAQAWAAELNRFFADDQLQLTVLQNKQWVWHSPTLPALQCCPLREATGRNVRQCLPQGEQVPAWTRLLTEAQMLLHSSAGNVQRRARGLMEVNSLWLWGMGRLPAARAGKFARLYGDDVFVAGLAQLTGASYASLPDGPEAVLRDVTADSALLVWDIDAQQDVAAQLIHWQQQWLLPLMAELKAGRLARLTVELGGGVALTATGKDLKRFWRRRRRLDTLES
ncbi:MAG: hypothetical protein OEW58_04965 [Gammaproteobacteria bacterium]|nr:hypothetical protein [Gammaproteobacteria bacterium]